MSVLKTIVFLGAMTCLPLLGEVETYKELKEAEKLALALTGVPLSDDQRTRLIEGLVNKDQIIDELTQSDSFIQRVARFWVQKLGASNRMNLFDTNGLARALQGENNPRFRPGQFELSDNQLDRIIAKFTGGISGRQRLSSKTCNGERWYFQFQYDDASYFTLEEIIATRTYNGSPIQSSLEKYRSILDLWEVINPPCDRPDLMEEIDIPEYPRDINGNKPILRMTKILVQDNVCGKNGQNCFEASRDLMMAHAGQDNTLEPGYIIGKTIAEDRNFAQVLTTSKTVMTSKLAYAYQEWFGDIIGSNRTMWDYFPGGKYQESVEPRWLNPNFEDNDLFWVERNPEVDAGVLTTVLYSLLTNGRRAKANVAYKVFTCREFTVPEGALPDPSDDNPDLRQRKYCAYCHRTLEPMASFFNRWPKVGDLRHVFDNDPSIDNSGVFRGQTGTGVRAYGQMLADSEDFKSCTIKRTFEFLHGRSMTQSEAKALVPSYTAVYDANNGRLRPVIKKMLNGKQFSGSQEISHETAEVLP